MLKVVCISVHVRWVLPTQTTQVESLLSGRRHAGNRGDHGDKVGGNLVGAHNTQRATPPLSPHLAYATAFSQVKLFLASFWSTFSAKIEASFRIRGHP